MIRLGQSLLTGFSLMGLIACQTVPPKLFIQSETLSAITADMPDLSAADVILIGETHDNADHHKLQADIINRVSPSAVVFEMVPADMTDAVNTAVASGRSIRDVLDWDNSGWPDWALYAPVFEAARAHKIIGAGVSKADIRLSMIEGAQAVSDVPDMYGLGDPLPTDVVAILIQEFIASHCGMIPESVAEKMIAAQRLRDASFAKAIVEAQTKNVQGPIILIAGSGHVAKDRGVPAYLTKARPDLTLLSIGLIENGVASDPDLFDFTIRTPAAQREDPCAAFQTDN